MTRWSFCHGALDSLAAALFKIASDIRLLGSGPRSRPRRIAAAGERAGLVDHARQGQSDPGGGADAWSASQVIGNETIVDLRRQPGPSRTQRVQAGDRQRPLQSIRLLADAADSFADALRRRYRGRPRADRRPRRPVPDAGDGAGAANRLRKRRGDRQGRASQRNDPARGGAEGSASTQRPSTGSSARRRWSGRK